MGPALAGQGGSAASTVSQPKGLCLVGLHSQAHCCWRSPLSNLSLPETDVLIAKSMSYEWRVPLCM